MKKTAILIAVLLLATIAILGCTQNKLQPPASFEWLPRRADFPLVCEARKLFSRGTSQ